MNSEENSSFQILSTVGYADFLLELCSSINSFSFNIQSLVRS